MAHENHIQADGQMHCQSNKQESYLDTFHLKMLRRN